MESPIILQTNRLKLYYGAFEALKGIDMQIPEKQITAFIGPSGCGKSTFLKTLNRMNDLVPGVRIEGEVARALAVEPDVLLMDEPTSALDPASTMRIEELMASLKESYTVVIVTHNMQQAARISDKCAFFLVGDLIEFGETEQVFSMPKDKRTEDYITGRFG